MSSRRNVISAFLVLSAGCSPDLATRAGDELFIPADCESIRKQPDARPLCDAEPCSLYSYRIEQLTDGTCIRFECCRTDLRLIASE